MVVISSYECVIVFLVLTCHPCLDTWLFQVITTPDTGSRPRPGGEGLWVRNSGQLQQNVRITVCGERWRVSSRSIINPQDTRKMNCSFVDLKYFAVDYDIKLEFTTFHYLNENNSLCYKEPLFVHLTLIFDCRILFTFFGLKKVVWFITEYYFDPKNVHN